MQLLFNSCLKHFLQNKQSVEDNANIGNSVRFASSNWCFASERSGLSAADMSLQFSSSSSPSLRLCSVKVVIV